MKEAPSLLQKSVLRNLIPAGIVSFSIPDIRETRKVLLNTFLKRKTEPYRSILTLLPWTGSSTATGLRMPGRLTAGEAALCQVRADSGRRVEAPLHCGLCPPSATGELRQPDQSGAHGSVVSATMRGPRLGNIRSFYNCPSLPHSHPPRPWAQSSSQQGRHGATGTLRRSYGGAAARMPPWDAPGPPGQGCEKHGSFWGREGLRRKCTAPANKPAAFNHKPSPTSQALNSAYLKTYLLPSQDSTHPVDTMKPRTRRSQHASACARSCFDSEVQVWAGPSRSKLKGSAPV